MANKTVSLKLAGTPRNHEARRKLIVRDLLAKKREAERTIRKIEKCLPAFGGDLTVMNTARPKDLRDALFTAWQVGADDQVEQILGLEPATLPSDALERRIFVGTRIFSRTEAGQSTGVESLDAARSLAEATRIASDARDASIEIDWSDNPQSDRERDLRLAIIHQIETEAAAAFKHRTGWSNVEWVSLGVLNGLRDLKRTIPEECDYMGEDLYDAFERWEAREAAALDEIRAQEARELRQRAMDSLRGNPNAGAGSNL